jgi:hypothetical protein
MVESRTSPRLIDELDELHAHYADAINRAVTEDDHRRAEALAAAYDDEAVHLVAEREGMTHLLPLVRPATPDTPLRRLVRRMSAPRAA